MKIVFLSQHGCMRVMKQAIPLMDKGHELHLIVNKITQYSDYFRTTSNFQEVSQLANSIKLHSDADIFHCHNEPNWFVTAVKEIFPDKPVILDIHDSMLLRRTQAQVDEAKDPEVFRHTVDERNNFQLADGIVYVCNPMKDIVGNEYKLDQPNLVLPSYVPKLFYRFDFFRYIGGLVYEGRIDLPDELPKRWDFFQYANYIDFSRECNDIGMDFHIYTPRKNKELREAYKDICFLHNPKSFKDLIKAVGHHDWGLVGNSKCFSEWQYALPNKMFEYFAGCLPVVCMNADESYNHIKDLGMGIFVNSISELAKRWAEHRECRKNVIKNRMSFAMDAHIHKLEEFYKEFV